jgi:chitobiase/beta-hexosaminidase-like protein
MKYTTSKAHRRRRTAAVLTTTALGASALAAAPASATVVDVAPGNNITVFENIDMVAVSGWAEGEDVTVNVIRNGVTISTATGPAADPEGTGVFGLEVNHGPEAAAAPGDCWEGQTADILPGDLIRATNGTETDEVVVDELMFTEGPLRDGRDVIVRGIANFANGKPIPIARLDSAEFRDGSRLRAEPNEIRVTRTAGAPGGFTMRYRFPFNFARNRDNLPPAQVRQRLLTRGHSIGFGHVEPPLPPEGMLLDGMDDAPGPAPGCAGAPARYAVTTVTPGAVNRSNLARGLTVRGVAHNATAVRAQLSDGTTTVSTPATGTTHWSATFTRAQLQRLDGRLSVSGRYTVPALTEGGQGGEITGKTQTVVKDLVAPTTPRATPKAGAHKGAQRVTLRSPGGDDIRWTLGDGLQPAPTATRGNLYAGPIAITADQVLKARSVDTAGNVSPILRQRYRIGDVPSRPRIGRASSGAAGGKATAASRWRAPLVANGRIQGYRVTALKLRPNGSVASKKVSRLLQPRTRSAQMRLTRGSYRFRVHAVNAFGKSRLSARSNRVQSR